MIRKLICLIFGHDADWKEYQDRLEREDIMVSHSLYCSRCRRYYKG